MADGHYFTAADARECERYRPRGEPEPVTGEAVGEIAQRSRRRRGQGSGYLLTRYSQARKYGQKYPQTYYQVEFGKRKRSIFIPSIEVEKIRALDREGVAVMAVLEAIDSPKAREVLGEYRSFLAEKSRISQ